MTIKTQKFFSTAGVIPTLFTEAKKHYDWCDCDADGNLSVHFRSSIIKYGAYSTLANEASFIVNFRLTDAVAHDGSLSWPFCGDFACEEKAEDVEKLAVKLIDDKNARKAIYRGRYRNTYSSSNSRSKYEFTIGDYHPTHILFVSDKWLGSAGNLYNCDVIITKDYYALAIPVRTYRYLTK